VPATDFIVDPADLDLTRIVADIDEIRRWIPQRDAMEQLTAIIHDDLEQHICVGYRDLTENEFWVGGHMPGFPLMPGVIMCEAAAQVLSYHVQRNNLSGVDVVGFGGIDNVKFRGVVRPGDRLVVAVQMTKHRRGRLVGCRFQEFVGTSLVCEGAITGIALPAQMLQADAASS